MGQEMKNDGQMHIKVEPELKKKILTRAEKTGRSMSAYIRLVLLKHLKEAKKLSDDALQDAV